MTTAFEPQAKVTNFQNNTLVLTTDGLYLTQNWVFRSVASGKLSNELKENNAEIGLELAQSDFQTVVQKEIDNKLVVNECNMLKKLIEVFSIKNEKFGKFTYLQQNDTLFQKWLDLLTIL